MQVYEIFKQEREGEPMKHAGNLRAPDDALALHYAKEFYSRRSESIRLWVVPRASIAEIADPDILRPALEEDVAYSSIAQDEIGHARALYELLAELTGRNADEIAYNRGPEGFRQARLLDLDRGDWARSIARRYLYDTADAVRLAALAQ